MESTYGPVRDQDKENGMAFIASSGGRMVDINVTPLVDVMLVLLIIFMVTVPAVSYPLQMDLPQAGSRADRNPPPPIRIHIDAGSTLSWNGSVISLDALPARFAAEAAPSLTPAGTFDSGRQPTIEIQTDSQAEYDTLAKVLSRAKNANLAKISFVK
jgi:biopolymer transport protein ExbD